MGCVTVLEGFSQDFAVARIFRLWWTLGVGGGLTSFVLSESGGRGRGTGREIELLQGDVTEVKDVECLAGVTE